MGSVLRIRNRELEDILCEGAQLIQHGIVTGFNFDQENAATQLALIVQYYHNIEAHIARFLDKMQGVFTNIFSQSLPWTRTSKWGLFKWDAGFEDEPGNKYYAVYSITPTPIHANFERISFPEIRSRIGNDLVLAKDKCAIITFAASDGVKARFLIDAIRTHCPKYLTPGVLNPERVDDYAHIKPLFILRDDNNCVANKSDLERVYRLELKKGARTISSVVQAKGLPTLLQKLKEFPCGLDVQPQERYVGQEFFTNY